MRLLPVALQDYYFLAAKQWVDAFRQKLCYTPVAYGSILVRVLPDLLCRCGSDDDPNTVLGSDFVL